MTNIQLLVYIILVCILTIIFGILFVEIPCRRAIRKLHEQREDIIEIMDLYNRKDSDPCRNPECPQAGQCGGECAKNF